MRYRNHSWRRNFGRAAFFAERSASSCLRRSSSLGFARASWTLSSTSSFSFGFFGFLRSGFSSSGSSFSAGFFFSSGGSAVSTSRAALASSFATNPRRRLRRSSTFPSVDSSYRSDQATSSAFFAARISEAFGSLHGRFHGEMAVHAFHLICVPFRHPDDHVAEVGGEGSDERALPPAGVLAADLRLLALDDNLDPRVGQLPAQRGPLRRHDDCIAVEPDLHASRDFDRLLQQTRDRHRPPQYT